MENHLRMIHGILQEAGIKSIKLIGHSAGGYYAQLFCELYPDMVKSVSLVSSMILLNSNKTRNIINGQWKFISF